MAMVLQKGYEHFTILWRENKVQFSVINKTFVTTFLHHIKIVSSKSEFSSSVKSNVKMKGFGD
jgi:hypothetical protein